MHVRHQPHTREATAVRSELGGPGADAVAARRHAHGGASFATLFARASSPVSSPSAPTTASAPTASAPATTEAPATTAAPASIALRRGETITAVEGHQYAEIHGGKRDGLFINTSQNPRRGEAFALVTDNGREMHVYGSGKDRLVVYVSPPRDPANPPPPVKLREGETMTPVPGHHYAQIHGGERDGMFINTSLNKRRGMAFVNVRKHGVDYHVYGSGKDRQVIRVVPHDPGATISAAATTGAGGTAGTVTTGAGGTAAAGTGGATATGTGGATAA